jgi:cardiolipin synthase
VAVASAAAPLAAPPPVASSAMAMCPAWLLVLFPFVALPLYWIFGRDKFSGYIVARRQDDSAIGHIIDEMEKREEQFRARLDEEAIDYHALESLATLPFTTSNAIELLVDGQATFDAIFDGIERAEKYSNCWPGQMGSDCKAKPQLSRLAFRKPSLLAA